MFLFDNMLHNIAKNIKKNPGLVSIPRNHVRQKRSSTNQKVSPKYSWTRY